MWPMGILLSFDVYNNQILVIYCMNRMPISMSDLNNYDSQQSNTIDQGFSNWINEEISRLSRFPLLAFCSAVIFKTWLKCVYIEKKTTGKRLSFYHTSKYVFSCYI